MSHIVTIQTQLRDPGAIAAACRRMGLAEPFQGTAKVFREEATGLIVQLPGWEYPVVCDTTTGSIRFDNYEGYWGEQAQLDRFMQAYAVEKARAEARRKGLSCIEQTLSDGSIKLTVQMGGVA